MTNSTENDHVKLLQHLSTAQLGGCRELIQLHSYTDNTHALARLCGQTRYRLNIYCHAMTPLIYDTTELLDSLQVFALRSPRAELRILVEDTTSIIQKCNRLLALSHRLSSRIGIRKTHEEFVDRLDEFATMDGTGYFHRPNSEHYAASCCFNNPGKTKEMEQFFEAAWQHSETDPELRNMVM